MERESTQQQLSERATIARAMSIELSGLVIHDADAGCMVTEGRIIDTVTRADAMDGYCRSGRCSGDQQGSAQAFACSRDLWAGCATAMLAVLRHAPPPSRRKGRRLCSESRGTGAGELAVAERNELRQQLMIGMENPMLWRMLHLLSGIRCMPSGNSFRIECRCPGARDDRRLRR